MRGIKTVVLVCLLVVLAPSRSSAGRMFSLDPRIGRPAAPRSSGEPDVAPVTLPSAFLERELLLSSTVIATSSERVLLGVSQIPVQVQPRVSDGAVELVRVRAPIGGDASLAGQPLARWPSVPAADGVAVTPLSPVEATTFDGTLYTAERPTASQDPVVEADRMAVTLHYSAKAANKPAAGDPESVELAVRLTLFFRPAPARPGRAYSEQDARTVGLFSLGTYESGVAGAPGDLAVHPDRETKLKFILHPSVPEMARNLITRGLLTWNPVLQKVVGAPLVEVEIGTDPTLMPGTPGAIVVYWFPVTVVEKFMGFAQPLADPRNGEIIGGQILLSEQQLLGDGAMQALVDEAILTAAPGTPRPAASATANPVARMLAAHAFRPEPRARASAALLAPAAGGSPDDVLAWTVVHEAGHLLGLRHNFRGSADVARIAAGHHSTSCMDYLPTPLAPRQPLAYDEHALAFGQGTPPPAGAEGPFAYAAEETMASDPDANQYDAGDPLEWARSYIQGLREQRVALPEASAPQISSGLVYLALGGTAKLAVNGSDPRHAAALRFLLTILSDQGADPAIGGGLAGKIDGDTTAEQARTKNLADRRAATARIVELAGAGRLPAAERDLFLRTLARTALDQGRTDLFEARRFALSTLAKMQGPDARLALWTMLSSLQRQLVSGKRTPAYAQDVKLFEKGRAALQEAVVRK